LEIVESEYAKLGTAAHELGAMCILQEREPYEFMGWEIGGYIVGNPDGIDPDAVAIYVAECERINPRDGKGIVTSKRRCTIPTMHPLLKGTVDFGYVRRSSCTCATTRTAKVSASRRRAISKCSTMGSLQALEHPLRSAGPRKRTVTLGIVQPNFYGIFEAPDVWETDLGTVLDYGHDVLLPRMNALMSTPRSTMGISSRARIANSAPS
jgi:hypothetical protein